MDLINATVAVYAASRITWRLLSFLRGWGRLIATHILAAGLIALLIGFIKSYFVAFPAAQASIVIVPALFWLLIDYLRGKQLENATTVRE